MQNPAIRKYIEQIQQLYYGPCWIDEDIEKKLRSVNEENAFVKPLGHIHSIAEIVSHMVEWRKELLHRIGTGKPRRLEMDSPNNWLPNQQLKENGWAPLKQTLLDTQQEMISLLENKSDDFLKDIWDEGCNYEWMIAGWVQHDAYHLGQIGLVWKMINHEKAI